MLLNHKLITTKKTRTGQVTKSPHLSQLQPSPTTHFQCPCPRPSSAHPEVFLEALLFQRYKDHLKDTSTGTDCKLWSGKKKWKQRHFSIPSTKLKFSCCVQSLFYRKSLLEDPSVLIEDRVWSPVKVTE